MKRIVNILFATLASVIVISSCEAALGDDQQLVIDPVEDAQLSQTLGAADLVAEEISFTTTGPWTSRVVPVSTKASQPMWVSITPDHGDEAGTYTAEIRLEANDTGADRKADIIITCGSQTITVSITQKASYDDPSYVRQFRRLLCGDRRRWR